MARRITSLSFLLMALLLVLQACDGGKPKTPAPTPEEMITKSWKLNKLDIKNEMVGPEIMGNSSFTFYKNGRYEILMGELERGKWSLSPNKKILITEKDNSGQKGEMDIETLTPTTLVLTNAGNETPMRMELNPM